jgi:peptide/nickel transport system substrate-binding protein
LFQEVEVRKALFFAIDRPALIESIRFGYGEVAVGSMPTLSWAYNPQGIEEPYDYNPEMAMQLLEDAGWVAGDDGIRAKDGMRLAFTMNTNAGNQVREAYLVAFQEYWAQIGVEMTPNLVPFPQLVEQLTTTFDFETFLIGFSWSATPDQAALFSCDAYGSGFNGVMYCNPEVDALLQEALSATDQDERIELYTEYQNLMLDDLPMPIIDFPRAIYGVNQRVHNFIPNYVNSRFNPEHWWVES